MKTVPLANNGGRISQTNRKARSDNLNTMGFPVSEYGMNRQNKLPEEKESEK